MCMELLHKMSERALPLPVTDIESIDKLRIFRAYDYVTVFFPPVDGKEPFARVLAITEQGREALPNLEVTSN
ncbi:MAG: hypothetical protein ABIR56_12510 [Polaromonas sp.]